MGIYDFNFTDITGQDHSLSEYEGKVLLIANTASKCGFTPQYEGLEELYQKYGSQGLVVIGFPCNQFREQEPGSNAEIEEFCKVRYGVTFPLSQKVDVRGADLDPIFDYLTAHTEFVGLGGGLKNKGLETMLRALYGKGYQDSSIKWNFTKFLIGRDGAIIGRYEPTTTPAELESVIAANL